ncbi:MAG: AAA-like domain-containing protein [Nostoc sp. JL34]|uniref:AAA-like domain-containing protein n=1 Tax=Nostoc sp. JL34 TaxID=2815397 RepID=UPI001D4B7C3F|nr:AAA-like domain-containing protein [Nostoc sp. JL34]MBN3884482.1 AAA-like domain-containing protein [Nostoc sp. JL34]
MTTPPQDYEYKVGGGLDSKAPSYVVRQADEEFYAALKSGKFCYVFNSRQMGKSSLQNCTAQRLRAEGIVCGTVALTLIGTHNVTEAGWYQGIIGRLKSSLGIRFQHRAWWNEREDIPPLQRFVEFIETVLLVEVSQPIVLFFDEIDSVFKFDFKDDFFALIRAFDEQRTEQLQYQRLTFALLGVATPADLIQDKSRTPFNIGQAIALEGFQLQEVQPLIPGLVGKAENPEAVLRIILEWTGGQPFLVQKLCQLVLNSPDPIAAGDEAAGIEQLVRSHILENWESQDNPQHLITIRNRLLEGGEQRSGRLLGLCQQIVQHGEIAADESPEQTTLRLTGLVVKQQGKLRVYNRIYAEVFNSSWFDQELGKLRVYGNELNAWMASNREDESRLLRGQALQNAQAWAKDKSLSDLDYQFLAASQDIDQKNVQIALDAQKKAYETLDIAKRKAGLIGIFTAVTLALTTVAVVMWAKKTVRFAFDKNKELTIKSSQLKIQNKTLSGENNQLVTHNKTLSGQNRQLSGLNTQLSTETTTAKEKLKDANQEANRAKSEAIEANQDKQQAQIALKQTKKKQQIAEAAAREEQAKAVLEEKKTQIAQTANRLEREGTASLKEFEFQQIQALISSIRSGEELKNLLSKNRISKLIDYPATSPLLALQIILDNIRLQNILDFPKDRGGVQTTNFSPDGQYILTTYGNSTAYVLNVSNQQEIKLAGDKDRKTNHASFSPDGQYILTTYDDGDSFTNDNDVVYVWKLSGQQQAKLITRNNNKFSVPSFSPDSHHILAISETGTALIWDLSKQQGLQFEAIELKEGQNKITIAKLNSSNQRIVTVSNSVTLSIWNLSGQRLSSFKDIVKSAFSSDCSVDGLTLSSNGQYIVTSRVSSLYAICGSLDRIWNLSGQLLAEFKDSSANFSPDSHFVAVSGLILDLSKQKQIKLKGEQNKTLNPSFTPNSQYIVTEDNAVYLWNLSGEKLLDFEGNFVGFSPDSKLIFTTSGVWNLSGQKIAGINSVKIGFSQDNKRVATINNDTVLIWNLQNQQPIKIEGKGIVDASFSPDSRQIITDSASGIGVWSLSGQHLNKLPNASVLGCNKGVIFSLNSQTFNSLERADIVCIWDLSKAGQTRKFEVNGEIYNDFRGGRLGFSSDGQRMLTISDGTVWMWDLSSGRKLSKIELKGQKGIDSSVILSPDSQLIATTSDDLTRIWDLSGQQLAEFKEDQSRITNNAFLQKYAYLQAECSLAVSFLKRGVAVHGKNKMNIFSPDGRHIVTPSSDRSIVYVWDLLTGNKLATLKGHQGEITSVSFSPDGQRILTASRDATARIWNLAGQQLAEFKSPDESNRFLLDASFSPDGQRIMVVGAYKVFIWHTEDLNQLLARGCNWLKDYLRTHPDAKICRNSTDN